MTPDQRFRTYLKMLEDLGVSLAPDATIVDLGCGAGRLVAAGRKRGYHVFGADIGFKESPETAELLASGVIRPIDLDPYRLPFDDASVDCIVSDQVFEHVMDYDACLVEMQRVLKPGGTTLHTFPSRYLLIEPHVFVPLGTMFRSRAWLRIWAALGVRNSMQRGLSSAEVSTRNFEYLRRHTNYLNRSEIRRHFERYFPEVRFAESSFLKHSERARILHKLSPVLPFLPRAYSFARGRVVFARRGASGESTEAPRLNLVVASGIEPPTTSMSRRCSTTELRD
jgi:ubiquinone/menaquinone biosynthesis C-methylase UbiE